MKRWNKGDNNLGSYFIRNDCVAIFHLPGAYSIVTIYVYDTLSYDQG